jgi:hypothetical protein
MRLVGRTSVVVVLHFGPSKTYVFSRSLVQYLLSSLPPTCCAGGPCSRPAPSILRPFLRLSPARTFEASHAPTTPPFVKGSVRVVLDPGTAGALPSRSWHSWSAAVAWKGGRSYEELPSCGNEGGARKFSRSWWDSTNIFKICEFVVSLSMVHLRVWGRCTETVRVVLDSAAERKRGIGEGCPPTSRYQQSTIHIRLTKTLDDMGFSSVLTPEMAMKTQYTD